MMGHRGKGEWVLAVCAVLASCSNTDAMLDHEVKSAKADAYASAVEVQTIAAFLISRKISWADDKSVRFRDEGGDMRTTLWDAAAMDRATGERIRPFIAKHGVKALFVEGQRVNFVRGGTGISPSGASVGWIISAESPKCEVVGAIDLSRKGVQCEQLSNGVYVYLQK